TYTVTQEANSTAYVSQRSHGVLWEKTGSLNAINLLSPNGGERLITDTWITVQWTSSPALAAHDVQIQASYDGGQVWQELAVMANAGGYEWRIPDARSNQCLIRISDVNDPNIADASDDTFLIYACDEPLRGDLNQDCFVNLLDWALMAQDWLRRPHVQPYEFPLDDDPQWTTQGQWAFGQPAGSGGAAYGHPDPASGFTGTQVYGVNLNGDYSTVAGGPYYLTAGPFNCRHYENMKLKFARWLNSDAPEFVTNMIDVSNDGSTWQRVWENTSAITDDHWQEVQYDISSVADDQENVYIRWGYQVNDRAYPYSGWNIDDVALWGNP
ncbi:MAG: hypothetical protein JW810_04025, partial [Sedimentisphaerales bacterium]|nr:hypothetical protein [Sedimentisphaerales bacterium]